MKKSCSIFHTWVKFQIFILFLNGFLGDYVVENEKSFLEDLINMHQRKMSCGGGDEAVHQLIDILFKHEKVSFFIQKLF